MSSRDEELDPVWIDRLSRLNAAVASKGEPLAGNLFYEHNQEDFATRPASPVYRAKRDRFRRAMLGRSQMLEIGVNGGHSALLALVANPDLHFHGVDICDHSYVEPVVGWLESEFPGRVFFHPGDSLRVLPELSRRRLSFDVFHIDGAKFNYLDDISNSARIADPACALVIVDDAETTSARIALSILSRLDLVRSLDAFPAMPDSEPNRHEVMTLLPSTGTKRLSIKLSARVLNGARRLKAIKEKDSEWADYHPSRANSQKPMVEAGRARRREPPGSSRRTRSAGTRDSRTGSPPLVGWDRSPGSTGSSRLRVPRARAHRAPGSQVPVSGSRDVSTSASPRRSPGRDGGTRHRKP